jgi:nicotinate dehydrogenase subunit B
MPEVGSRSSLEVPLAARFDLSSPGLVIVKTGKVELGQGILLALRQIAAEELDLTADAVVTVSGDTSTSLFEGGTVGSMSIETSGCELRDAAAELRAVLLDAAARKVGMSVAEITAEDGEIFVAGIRSKETFWSLAAEIPFDRVLERSAVPKSPEALQDGRDEHAADAIA